MRRTSSRFQPSAEMQAALVEVPGASHAKWFKLGPLIYSGAAVALVPPGASGIVRERLFLISRGRAVELVLGCPKCRKELFRIEAKTCAYCGSTLIPERGFLLGKNKIAFLCQLMAFGVALISYLERSRGLSWVAIPFGLAGVVFQFWGSEEEKVRLLYRFDPDGEFSDQRVMKLSPKALTRGKAIPAIGRALHHDVGIALAKWRRNAPEKAPTRGAVTAMQSEQTRWADSRSGEPDTTPAARGRWSLSEAFSPGKQERR